VSRKSRSVDVKIELPNDSQVSGELQMGAFHSSGRLGACSLKLSAGSLRCEQVGPLQLRTGLGDVVAEVVSGDSEVSTGSGSVRIERVVGTATIKNSNGETTVNAAYGDLGVRAANGSIRVARAAADLTAKTSNGGVHVGELARGAAVLETALGDVDIGIAAGTAAWLDVNMKLGQVRN